MNRRELLEATTVMTMSAALFSRATASAAATPAALAKIADTAAKCIASGLLCAKHCEDIMATGNKDMAACLATVQDMLAACEALQRLAVRGSKHAPAMAKACAAVCADCVKACEPHLKMDVCRKCMEDCKECEAACNAV